MNILLRISSLLSLLILAGCASNGPVSELRESVEAPVQVSEVESPFCAKPEVIDVKLPKPQVAAAPPLFTPFSASLYFLLDQIVFTPESAREADEIYQQVRAKNADEVILIGHTDTSASNSYNDILSLRRAEKVKQALIAAGVAADTIRISGRGEADLFVATPDETVEVRNRRVEITLR
ncbi:MAG: OmpA family protein [Methylophaga sp.]|nr:OmpA family protein [Methylophaga sp.]